MQHAVDTFAGTRRFQVLRLLGEGGMGLVYEALDREHDVRVALKTMRHVDPGSVYLLKQEFRSLATVVHPNLVRLFELVSDGDQPFFTMELIDGRDYLAHLRPGGLVRPSEPIESPAYAATALPPQTDTTKPWRTRKSQHETNSARPMAGSN